MAILPSDEAAQILAHYFKSLASHAGLRWTDANDRDMARLSTLLDQAEPQGDAGDTIPPYRPDTPALETRVTQNLDQDAAGWRQFRRWQAERADEERHEAARRIMRR